MKCIFLTRNIYKKHIKNEKLELHKVKFIIFIHLVMLFSKITNYLEEHCEIYHINLFVCISFGYYKK